MMLMKSSLFAAMAVTAALLFVDVTSASATPTWIGVCLEQELLNCKNLVKHPLSGRILASMSEGSFKSGFVITCKSGLGESNLLPSQQNGSAKGVYETLGLVTCIGGCSKVGIRTPQNMELSMETAETESWRAKTSNLKVIFSECLFGVECEFEGNLNFKVQMDKEGAYTDPEGAEFNLIKGSKLLCGSTGRWESGRVRYSWSLDDAEKTTHTHIWPSLIGANLIPVS
jgi:hypothetical protein